MDDKGMDPGATEDAVVARLRAADVAGAAEPDLTALRVAVDERIAGPATDEVAARRARRWTGWPAKVAGVAAAALVVGGGGGYAIGAMGDEGPPAAAPITLQGGATGNAPTAAGGQETGPMAATDSARGGGFGTAMWPGYWGHTLFTASDLSYAGGMAQAWAFDPAQVFTEQTVAALAVALGVPGSPSMSYGSWTVGPTDGTGPTVSMSPDGTATVNYYDPTKDPWSCPSTPIEQQADPGAGASQPEPEPCTQRDLGAAPQGDAAVAQARDALAAIGLDPAAFELVTEDYGDQMWSSVSAYQVVDGQRSGITWGASFTGAGLQSLYGSLAPVASIGEYEVISPTAAVDRLNDPRFGAGMSGGPILAADGVGSAGGTVEAVEPTLPPTAGTGVAIRWPVQQVTVVEARLGVALYSQPDGSALLVPTYELTGEDGSVWSVVAVADAELDFSAGR